MVNLEEYELIGTQLEDVAIHHAVKGCNAYQTMYTSSRVTLADPTVADVMKWIEEHEKEYHSPKPLTQEQKIESRKRWDAAYDAAQTRDNG